MNKSKGFTLIELLIVIAIIGIISAVAYPSYQDSVRQSRRADAQGALLGFAQEMERNYTTNGLYTGAAAGGNDTGAPTVFPTTVPIDGTNVPYYNLIIVAADASSYVLGAEPIGSQASDGILILKSTGERGWDANNDAGGVVANLGASPNEVDVSERCWRKNC